MKHPRWTNPSTAIENPDVVDRRGDLLASPADLPADPWQGTGILVVGGLIGAALGVALSGVMTSGARLFRKR